jgi:hypothetical protein
VAEVIEAQSLEEEISPTEEVTETEEVRPLPVRSESVLPAIPDEVRSVAVATAGGLVAGAATIAAVNVVKVGAKAGLRKVVRRKPRDPRESAVSKRSVLIDIHVLER